MYSSEGCPPQGAVVCVVCQGVCGDICAEQGGFCEEGSQRGVWHGVDGYRELSGHPLNH